MKTCPQCGNRKRQGLHNCATADWSDDPPSDTLESLRSYPNGMTPKQQLAEMRASMASIIYRLSEPADQ